MDFPVTSAALHAFCAAIFCALTALIAARGLVSRTGRFLAAASLATTGWAAAVALGFFGVGAILETARTAAWALFAGHLLRGVMRERSNVPRWILASPIGALVLTTLALQMPLVFGVHLGVAAGLDSQSVLIQLDWVLRILLAVLGCLILENLYRNAVSDSRWHINLLIIGVGGLFIYDVVLYADAVLFHRLSLPLFVARAPVDAVTAPLIALAVARNKRWLVDIHVSRNVVFHSSTLIISGIFLVAIALVGEILRNIGVTWGPVIEITLVFAAIVVVAVVLTSGRARSTLRAFIVQNFFTYRYDYRKVWLGFIETISNPSFSGEQLRVRVIRAVADTVDSPAGCLWLRDAEGTAFSCVANWNLPRGGAPVEGEFAGAFGDGERVLEIANPGAGLAVPTALAQTQRAWLVVPLSHLGRLLGFILLTEPRAAIRLNWENYELLRIVGRQVASYLAEEQAARALVEARQIHAYSQRFAFVVHDIKNLVSQLSMIVSNGAQHADDPEFQRDVLETVRHSVASMNKLLAQLRANRDAENERVLPEMVVAELVRAWRPRKPVKVRFYHDDGAARVRIGRDALESALRHLLDNAAEVSPEGGAVTVELSHVAGNVMIDIRDEGAGMSSEFVASQLFQPFRSTKSEGYGIGAYQTRELVRAARGDLLVLSAPGKGTTMRIVLPAETDGALLPEQARV